MKPIISVRDLGKMYRIRSEEKKRYLTLRDELAEGFRKLWNGKLGQSTTEEFWALKDINFDIYPGEVVGIIGRNGAGKSTLLKILSRITPPTKGEAILGGRVGSLLEVGTGFHPELTGRENIYLSGAILGMSRAEIKRKFDEIVAFAEVEKFIDTPVKRYSSGMYVRLAFGVAAHLEPEILVVDEVLAVGDAEFQNKCLGKMESVSQKEGRTVLFVSHNMQAISTLTQDCLLLSKGKCVFKGSSEEAIIEYLKENQLKELIYTDSPSDKRPKITRVELQTSLPNNNQINGQPMEVIFEITTPISIRGACLSFQIINSMQQPFLHLWVFDSEQPMCREPGNFRLICKIPQLRLYMGSYSLTVYFTEPPGGDKFQIIENICPFEITMYGHYREFEWKPGTCAYIEDCQWNIEKII
jgi:lipopolysaccharide transport system ATP-binding protein